MVKFKKELKPLPVFHLHLWAMMLWYIWLYYVMFAQQVVNFTAILFCIIVWNKKYILCNPHMTYIFAADMFPYKITEPFQELGFLSQLPKKP